MTAPGRTLYDRLREIQAQGEANGREDRGTPGRITAMQFGAIGDGDSHPLSGYYATLAQAQVDFPCATALTDERDWAAIQTMCDYAESLANRVWLYLPNVPNGSYMTNDTIMVAPWCSFICEGFIIYTGPHDRPALIIGASTVQSNNTEHRLAILSGTQSDWTNEAYIGIQLINHEASTFNIVRAQGFTIGVQCLGAGFAFAYNIVTLGDLNNNKVGLDLSNVTAGGSIGWCNRNNWVGGRFRCNSGVHVGEDRWGVRIGSQDVSPYYNNDQLFLGPSFELTSTTNGYCFRFVHATRVRMIGGRNDGSHATISAQVLNLSQYYDLDWAYGTAAAEEAGTVFSGRETHRMLQQTEQARRVIFQSGPVNKTWCYYNGETNIHVPRCQFAYYSTATHYAGLHIPAETVDYIELSTLYGLGVRVQTGSVRKFCIKRDTMASYPGRVGVRVYDSAGAQLTGTAPYYVRSSGVVAFFGYSANFGGHYVLGADTAEDVYIDLEATVCYAEIYCLGGTATARVKSFSIIALDGRYDAAPFVDYEEIVPGSNIGSAAPTGGTWAVGKRIWNAAPASGGTEGWICTVAGTPGTWKAFGVIA